MTLGFSGVTRTILEIHNVKSGDVNGGCDANYFDSLEVLNVDKTVTKERNVFV